MHHQAAEDIFISPRANHFDLTSATFFCWSSHCHNTAADFTLLDGLCCSYYGRKTRGGNEIMTTGVPNRVKSIISVMLTVSTRKRYVCFPYLLKVNSHCSAIFWPVRGFESSRKTKCTSFHLKPTPFQEFCQNTMSVMLLV